MTPAAIRKLIDQVLRTDDDLSAFVIDMFPSVSREFAAAMTRTARVNMLFTSIGHTVVFAKLGEQYPAEVERALQRFLGEVSSSVVPSVHAAYRPAEPKTTWIERPEQAKVLRLLDAGKAGIEPAKVLLHGIGGVGKTALAAQVAAARRDYFSGQLLQVRVAKRVLEEVLSDLLEALTGSRPQEGPEQRWVQQIRGLLLGRQPVLLILDDLRLTDAPWSQQEPLQNLLEAVASATVLITSRSRLAPTGCAAIEVASLPEALAVDLSLQLCQQRELSMSAHEAGELAVLLGGLPFALERAAELMQSDQLSAASLLLRMHAEGRDPERLLAKLLQWSYEALDEEARLVLVAMGQLAEAPVPESLLDGLLPQVNRAEAVTRLIRSNLLQRSEKVPGVFTYQQHTLLWEWAEQLGAEKHADAVTAIRHRIDESLRSHNPQLAPHLLDHILSAQKLAEQRELPEQVIELAMDFDQSLATFGHWRVRRELLQRAIRSARTGTEREKLAGLLRRRGIVSSMQGDYANARNDYQECLSIRRALGDRLGVAWELNNLGELDRLQGSYESARKFLTDSLSLMRELKHSQGIATVQGNLGNVVREQGDFDAARRLFEESLTIRRSIGDHAGTAYVLSKLGIVARRQGHMDEARKLHEESLAISRELGDRAGIAWTLNSLGALARTQGMYDHARTFYEESLELSKALGDLLGVASALMNLGTLDQQQGLYARSQEKYQESLVLMRELGDRAGIASCLQGLGVVARLQGRYDAARALYEEGLAIALELGSRDSAAMILGNLGNVAQSEGNHPRAVQLYNESLAIRKELGDKAGIARTLNNLGELARVQGDLAVARKHYEDSLVIRKELVDRPGIASTLLNLGGLAALQKESQVAEKILREAEQIACAMSTGNKTLARIRFEQGALAASNGQQAEARRLMDSAVEMLQALGDPFLKEAERFRAALGVQQKDEESSSENVTNSPVLEYTKNQPTRRERI